MQVKTAALLCSGLAVLLVVLFGRLPGDGQWVIDLSNAAHGPAFMLLTIIALCLAAETKSRNIPLLGKYAVAITATILLGTIVEILQHFTGRDAELRDLWQDALGAVAAAGSFLIFDPEVTASPRRKMLRRSGFVLAITACVLMLAPLANTASAYLHRHRSFPILYDFNCPLSTYFLWISSPILAEQEALPPDIPGGGQGDAGLHVSLQDHEGWWGIFLKEPKGDWRGYGRLVLDLANPTDVPFRLKMRVRDGGQMHVDDAGFLTEIEITPHSRQTFGVPLEHLETSTGLRKVDTSTVGSIVLSGSFANRGTEFYVMRIWLE